MKNHNPVSIVILVHNEVDIIEKVILDFYNKIIKKIPGSEILIAEDGSTDGTKDLLYKLDQRLDNLKLFEGKEKLGYVNAFMRIMRLPKNELILFCDSSGKHDPDDFWKMQEHIEKYDMIIGYKVNRQDEWYRVVMGKVFNFIVRKYFNVKFTDIDCPFRLIKKQSLLEVFKQNIIEKSLINYELTLRFYFSGYKVTQVPVKHFKRMNGGSRGLPLKKIPSVVFEVLRNFPLLKRELQILKWSLK